MKNDYTSWKVITMSGTLIFDNFCQDKVDIVVQGFIDELIERDKNRIDSLELCVG